MQLSMRVHVPFPRLDAAYDPPIQRDGTNPTALATLAQWSPQPNMPRSRSAFAVAVAHALKGKAGASHFCVTAKQSTAETPDVFRDFATQYDGFFYEFGGVVYADNPSLYPLLPVLGVKGSITGLLGDSGGGFGAYLWDEKKTTPILSYMGEAKLARDLMQQTNDYAKHNAPLAAFFIDMSQQSHVKSLFSGGAADWIGAGDYVLPQFAALAIPVIIKVPTPNSMSPGVLAFIGKVHQYLGANASWTCVFPVGSSMRDQFAGACEGPFIDYFNVTLNGTLVHADGTGNEASMTPSAFKSTVLDNPVYADRHVMMESGGDSLLVLGAI